MHIQIDAARTILAYGEFTADHEDPTITIVEVDDSLLDTLQQPGIKTLEADGSITVTPDLAAQEAEQARQESIAQAEAKRAQSVQTLMAAMPSDAAREALADILGL